MKHLAIGNIFSIVGVDNAISSVHAILIILMYFLGLVHRKIK